MLGDNRGKCELNDKTIAESSEEDVTTNADFTNIAIVERICGTPSDLCTPIGWFSSEILQGRESDAKKMEEWLGRETSWELCYRAADDGWTGSAFHAGCDSKQETVTIIRVGTYIFGGYSDVSFEGSGYLTSSRAFVFSLVNKNSSLGAFKAPVKSSQHAIYAKSSYGPTFGGGHDIHIASNAASSAASYSNFGFSYTLPNGYFFETTQARELLAGSRYFTPNEVEVFYNTISAQ